MLPILRSNEFEYSIPKFEIVNKDVESFAEELKGFHGEFKDCFSRKELKDNLYKYMVGQFSDLERKSIEPMALNVFNGGVRALQRFISEIHWDIDRMKHIYHNLVNEDLGDAKGALVFDESGTVKKGDNSAGVSRQYCGSVGKVENSQVGVYASYVSPHGYCLIDHRLFMPEKWFEDDYEEKRRKCNISDSLKFKTKPELAVEMLKDIAKEKILPFKYIAADSIYGNSPTFIDAVDKLTGVIYFVSVPSSTQCWLKSPVTENKEYKYRGKKKRKKILSQKEKPPSSLESIAKNMNDFFWYRRVVSEGTKGPIEYEFARRQITLAKNGLPWKKVWLILKRTVGEEKEYTYYISNAPTSTKLKTFVWLSGIRWAIEQCFEEAKTELGMDHYEVRKLPGWYHHIFITMLTHFFLWHIKIKLGKKSTIHYSIAA